MARANAMWVANFVCRFGEDFVLLDFLNEIVLEAFTKEGRKRTYADKSYFFLNPQLIDLSARGEVEKAIAGRLVKITTVSREQIFVDGELVHDEKELESAPSSLFVLLLSNHKLLYVRETKDAPGLAAFESTAKAFIRQAHQEYIDSLREAIEQRGERVAKDDLYAQVPRPSVEVVALSSSTSLKAFIKRYDVLTSVQVRLIERNDELDNSPLFENLRKAKDGTKASTALVELKKGGKEGLDKAAVEEFLETPAEQGNSQIKLSGKDKNGEVLRGNNEDFKLIVPLDLAVDTIKQAAIKIHNKFKTVRDLLKIPPLTDEMKAKLKNIGD
jgi:hypothetical protein